MSLLHSGFLKERSCWPQCSSFLISGWEGGGKSIPFQFSFLFFNVIKFKHTSSLVERLGGGVCCKDLSPSNPERHSAFSNIALCHRGFVSYEEKEKGNRYRRNEGFHLHDSNGDEMGTLPHPALISLVTRFLCSAQWMESRCHVASVCVYTHAIFSSVMRRGFLPLSGPAQTRLSLSSATAAAQI